nr:MAG: polyprotein [Iflaviridae sp.]
MTTQITNFIKESSLIAKINKNNQIHKRCDPDYCEDDCEDQFRSILNWLETILYACRKELILDDRLKNIIKRHWAPNYLLREVEALVRCLNDRLVKLGFVIREESPKLKELEAQISEVSIDETIEELKPVKPEIVHIVSKANISKIPKLKTSVVKPIKVRRPKTVKVLEVVPKVDLTIKPENESRMNEKEQRALVVNTYHTWIQRKQLTVMEEYIRRVDSSWTCTLRSAKWQYRGDGSTKKEAKYEAVYLVCMNEIEEDLPRITTLGEFLPETCVGEMEEPDESGVGTVDETPAGTTLLTTAHGTNESAVAIGKESNFSEYMDGGLAQFPELCDRFLHFKNIDWSISDASGSLLGAFDMPRNIINMYKNSPNVAPFFQYALSAPQMEYQILFNSTQFHSGTIIVAARYNDRPDSGIPIEDARQLLSMPHILIQACASNTGVLSVPFMYPNHFVPAVDTPMGFGLYYHTLYIGVLNRLGIGDGGSNTVTAQVYARFSADNQQTTFAMQRIRVEGEMGLLDMIPGFSTVSNITKTVEQAASGIGAVLQSLNQDRPTRKEDRIEVTVQPVPNLALGDGPIDLASLRLTKDSLTPFPPGLVPVDHQCTLEYLKKVKNAIAVFNWGTGNTRGQKLWEWNPTPMAAFPVGSVCLHTTLTEIASFFQYYTGNMNLEFLFGSSLRHSGRLLIVFQPDTRPIEIQDAYSYPYLVYDLAETQTFTLVVPNSSATHLTPIMSRTIGGTPSAAFSYGKIVVFVETPLKILNSVSSNIDCTVLLSANDNMKFYCPHFDVSQSSVVGEMEEERTEDKQNLEMVKIMDAPEHTIGEKFELLPLMRRFGLVGSFTLKGGQSRTIIVRPSSTDLGDGANSKRDLIAHMAEGFRFTKGGLRFSITATSSQPIVGLMVTYYPWFDGVESQQTRTDSDLISPRTVPMQLTNSGTNASLTVEVPYYNNRRFLVNGSKQAGDRYRSMIDSLGQMAISCLGSSDQQVNVYLARATTDDFEMFTYQGFPLRNTTILEKGIIDLTAHSTLKNLAKLISKTATWYYGAPAIDQTYPTAQAADGFLVPGMCYNVGGAPTKNNQLVLDVKNTDPDSVVCVDTSTSIVEIHNRPLPALGELTYTAVRAHVTSSSEMGKYTWSCAGESQTYANKETSNDNTVRRNDTRLGGWFAKSWAFTKTVVQSLPVPATTEPIIYNVDYPEIYVYVKGSQRVVTVVYGQHVKLESIPSSQEDYANIMVDIEKPTFDLNPETVIQVDEVESRENFAAVASTTEAGFQGESAGVDLSGPVESAIDVINKLRKANIRIPRSVEKKFNPTVLSTRMNVKYKQAFSSVMFCPSDKVEGEMQSIRSFIGAIRSVPETMRSVNEIGRVAERVNESLEQVDPIVSVSTAAENVSSVFSRLDGALSSIGNCVAGTFEWFTALTKVLLTGLPAGAEAIGSKIMSSILNLYTLLFSSELKARIVSVISIFVNLGFSAIDYVKSFSLLSSLPTENPPPPEVVGEMDDEEFQARYDSVYKWFAYLIPLVVATLGFKSNYARSGMSAFATAIRESVRCSNDIARFFTYNVTFIKDFIAWWFGNDRPDLRAIAVLQDKKEEMLSWGEKVCEITEGCRRDQVFASAGQQKQLDLLYREGTEFLSLMSDRRLNSSVFMMLFKKLADLHQAVGQRVGRGRLLKEPLRLWCYGPPGTGKSNMAAKLSCDYLEMKGIVYDGNPVYVRNFTEYWNGWADQPCVAYDDFLQNTNPEEASKLTNEYFSLASIAEFNAPMPAIEDKDRMVNPEVVVVCSNQGYPNVQCVSSPEAFLRRRDFVIYCDLRPDLKALGVRNADDPRISIDELNNFSHLVFSIKNSFTDITKAENLTYDQLVAYIFRESQIIMQRRTVAATRRAAYATQLTPAAWQRRLEAGALSPDVVESVRRQIATDDRTMYDRIEDREIGMQGECGYCETQLPSYGRNNRIVWPNETPYPPSESSELYDGENLVRPCICSVITRAGEWCPYLWGYTLDKTYAPESWQSVPTNYIFIGLRDFCGDGCTTQSWQERMQDFVRIWPTRLDGAYAHLPNLLQDCMIEPAFRGYFDIEPDGSILPPQEHRFMFYTGAPITLQHPPNGLYAKFKVWLNSITARDIGIYAVMGVCLISILYIAFMFYTLVNSLCDSLIGGVTSIIAKLGIYYATRDVFVKAMNEVVNRINQAAFHTAGVLGEMTGSGDVRTMGRLVTRAVRGQVDEPCSVYADNPVEPPKTEVNGVDARVCENTLWMLFKLKNGSTLWTRILCLEGRTCIAPWHYFLRVDKLGCEGLELHSYKGGDRVIYALDYASLRPRRIRQFDLCAFVLPERVPLRKSIVQLFADTRYLTEVFRGKGRILEKEGSNIPRITHVQMKSVIGVCEYDEAKNELIGYAYDYRGPGRCMSAVMSDDANMIVGVHVCGSGDSGMCVSLTREMMREVCAQIEPGAALPATSAIVKADPKKTPIMELYGEAEIIGKTKPGLEMRYPARTQIKPSPMTGVLCEPVRTPAKLRMSGENAVGYGPIAVGASKQLVAPKPFPKDLIDIAVADITNMCISKAIPAGKVVTSQRSMKEAIFGIEGKPFCESIRMNTSPGYPFCCVYKGDKHSLFEKFDHEEKLYELKKDVVQMYEVEHAERLAGRVPECVYADFPKDERLAPGKDTRLINGQSFTELLEMRKYCMDFMSAFTDANLNCEHAIGMNVFGKGFDEIARKLGEVSKNKVLTGDYSRFGPTLQAECVGRIPEIMNAWYDFHAAGKDLSEDNKVRKMLYSNLCNCVHVAGDLLYRTQCGSPSGNCYTVQNNTLVNLMYLRVCWLVVFQGTSMATMSAFHRYFRPVCLGDDFVGSIDASLSERFNNVKMSECFAKFGIKFTDAVKSGQMRPYCHLEEASFLKSTFARAPDDRDCYVAQMDKTVIEDIINWQRFKERDDEYLKDVCDMVLRFAFLHGEPYFNTVRDKMLKWFQCEAVLWAPLSYDALWLNFENTSVDWMENWSLLGV